MWQQVQQTETETVQDFIDFSLAWLEDRNYSLTVDVDMAAWARKMGDAPSIALVNPTFDPRWSPVTPENSFWLDLRVGWQTVAMMASRFFVTDDYMGLKRSRKLWYDPPRPGDGELAVTPPPDLPLISGRVGHEGGLWVHPEHRKRGLSVILPHLNRALAFRQWNLDWQTGLALRGVGQSGIVTWAYGVPHVVPCYEGRSPLNDKHDRLFLAYMNRAELLAGLHLDTIAGLLADRHEQPVDRAPLVQKR